MTKFKLDLYQGVQFKITDNVVCGSQAEFIDYLKRNGGGRSVVHTETQNLVRFRPNLSLVVALPTEFTDSILETNYCQFIDDKGKHWFYFVESVEFVSRMSIRVNRTIDSLNTFYDSASFKKNCHITRRNKRRWKVLPDGSFTPIYDYAGEGFDIAQTLIESKVINEYGGASMTPEWLMGITTETENNAQEGVIRFYPVGGDNTYTIKAKFRNVADTLDPSNPPTPTTKSVAYATFRSLDLTGQTFNEKEGKQVAIAHLYALPYYPPVLGTNKGTGDNMDFSDGTFANWYYRNFTDQPDSKSVIYASCPANSVLQTISNPPTASAYSRIIYQDKLVNEYRFPTSSATNYQWRKAELESMQFNPDTTPEPKLGTSQFRLIKFEYLGATFNICPEKTSDGTRGKTTILYYVSYNSGTPIMFRVGQSSSTKSWDYRYDSDDMGYMIPSADITFPMWTSEYENYINFSNKYDKAGAWLSTISSIGNAGAGIAGSVLAGARTGNPLAIVGGVITSAFTAITSIIGTWNSYNAKVTNEKQKSMNVTQSTIDFATIETRNKARFLFYSIPDFLKRALNNYFHLFGYATDEYGDPKDYDHQNYSYNFIKMDSVHLKNEYSQIPNAFMDTFIDKLEEGYWKLHKIGDSFNSWFDFAKENANLEISLIELSAKKG